MCSFQEWHNIGKNLLPKKFATQSIRWIGRFISEHLSPGGRAAPLVDAKLPCGSKQTPSARWATSLSNYPWRIVFRNRGEELGKVTKPGGLTRRSWGKQSHFLGKLMRLLLLGLFPVTLVLLLLESDIDMPSILTQINAISAAICCCCGFFF